MKQVNTTLTIILARMKDLAKRLPEYPIVRAMGGVGDVLAPKLIAEIGDIRRFHSGKACFYGYVKTLKNKRVQTCPIIN